MNAKGLSYIIKPLVTPGKTSSRGEQRSPESSTMTSCLPYIGERLGNKGNPRVYPLPTKGRGKAPRGCLAGFAAFAGGNLQK
jgi:hypothetical protein